MFQSYREIFDQRAREYHEAMRLHPRARDEEFANIVEVAAPSAGELLVDIPSGGGYLTAWMPEGVRLIGAETSMAFVEQGRDEYTCSRVLCESMARLPVRPATVDTIVNLAGLHHEPDPAGFFAAAHAALRPGSAFCIADVRSGSGPDGFLNGFVHAHSSMGHEGHFLDAGIADALEHAGLSVELLGPRGYSWQFPDTSAMAHYCQLLVGIDNADRERIQEGIQRHLGVDVEDAGCALRWELLFVRARRP